LVIVVMGVAGVGKTTVGRQLADELGWPFYDADDLHPPVNIERMRSGSPLTDEQRTPWLAGLAALIAEHARTDRSMVLACSALRRSHRTTLMGEAPDARNVRLVYLRLDPALLADRLGLRADHFFPPDLLASQLAALEPPDDTEAVLMLDGAQQAAELVAMIRGELGV
jgi:gluconokinase